jgi:hypothetical protein
MCSYTLARDRHQVVYIDRVDLNSPVPTPSRESLAVRAPRYASYWLSMAVKDQQLLAASGIPYPRCVISISRGQTFPIWAPGHAKNPVAVTAKTLRFLA